MTDKIPAQSVIETPQRPDANWADLVEAKKRFEAIRRDRGDRTPSDDTRVGRPLDP